MRALAVCLLAALWCAGCGGKEEIRAASAQTPPASVVPGEYIVTVAPSAGAAAVREAYDAFGIDSLRDLKRGRFLIRLSNDPGLDAVRRAGAAAGAIESVERNLKYRYQR